MNTPSPINSPVIVLNSWGSFHVYPATVELAKSLIQEKIAQLGEDHIGGLQVLAQKKAFAENPGDLSVPFLVSSDLVVKSMSDLLSLEIGAESRALYVTSTHGKLESGLKLPTTKALRDELVIWCFENDVDVNALSDVAWGSTRPVQSLSFLSGVLSKSNGHPIQYVQDYVLDEAEEIEVLLRGKWKPTAKIENVVQRYLTFLNRYSHRDEQYHLGTMEGQSA